MAEITCKQCGHVNEAERVYCHSCGAKLERVLMPEEAKPEVTREKERARIKKLTNPPREVVKRAVSTFCLVLLWSVVAAALVQIARPPDRVPPMPKEKALDVEPLSQDLEAALESPTPQQIAIQEEVINGYLMNRIKPGEPGLAGTVTFDRVFLNLDEGVCRMVSQRSFEGYPLYGSVLYHLSINGNAVRATCVGGYFGRLPVHPMLMASLEVIYHDLWDKLKSEHRLMDQMASIAVHKKSIVVVTYAAKP
jgi:hypothetical protein